MTNWKCKDCVEPKRHAGCHSECPDYLEQKAKHEERREAIAKERQIQNALYSDRQAKVRKAYKRRRKP